MIRIVLVDDNLEVRNSLTEYFQNVPDIELDGTAENGEEGYKQICNLKPDVAILDIVMPRLDGLGLLERLAQNQSCANTCYIMYSAIGNDKVCLLYTSGGRFLANMKLNLQNQHIPSRFLWTSDLLKLPPAFP